MEYNEEISHRIHNVAYKVSSLSTGRLGWISGQQNSDGEWDGYGFVIGEGFAYFSNEQLLTMTESQLIASAFQQVHKFKLNSPEHIADKLKHLFDERNECEAQLEGLSLRIRELNYAISKLEAIKQSE